MVIQMKYLCVATGYDFFKIILWPTFATVSKFGHFRSLHDASVDSAVNEYLAIDSDGHVSE